MRDPIDPKSACVFKALLGIEVNRRRPIHFLNAVLGVTLPAPIHQAEIPNPHSEREFLDDKLSSIDVKTHDGQGRLYQVKIQLLNHADLPARTLYTWADLYSAQRRNGAMARTMANCVPLRHLATGGKSAARWPDLRLAAK